jgi:dolichyl-phosphate-mannose-protein mannosyltransferase
MSSSPSRPDAGAPREALVVAALTAVAGLLRIWSLGRLGLVHFDEGIYARAGTWVFSPKGLAGLDPDVISYAPPGFPFLVGLAYGLLGKSDVAAILVSIVAGTLTIPIVGWLGYRTFGRGAGAAASAFAALSGPHIAFSRMALTDCSFLLFWLLAIGLGQRFLEKPGFPRAIVLGLAVGVAQLLKYNGWIAGVVVALSAAMWAIVRLEDRAVKTQRAVWGWGLLAAMIAAVVYWPWYRFVEVHGGYAALLAHQRGYLRSPSWWPGHAILQLQQDRALSGGIWWLTLSGFAGAISMQATLGAPAFGSRCLARNLLVTLSLPALILWFSPLFGPFLWMIGFIGFGMRTATKAACVLGVGWAVMAILTPFYHPYARLLLPLQGLSWLLLAGALVMLRTNLERLGDQVQRPARGIAQALLPAAVGLWITPLLLASYTPYWSAARGISELLQPSDSLRTACRTVAGDLPRELDSLRLYARRPVEFYLSGVAPVAPQPTLDRLLEPGAAKTWALLDAAMIRQGGTVKGRLAVANDRLELVREIPTRLNLPTLLDIDPSSATQREPDRSAPLILFRPRRPGAAR